MAAVDGGDDDSPADKGQIVLENVAADSSQESSDDRSVYSISVPTLKKLIYPNENSSVYADFPFTFTVQYTYLLYLFKTHRYLEQ